MPKIKKDVKTATIWLGYFKQGDDMNHCLTETENNIIKAFETHAELMLSVADHLKGVAKCLGKVSPGNLKEIEVFADTHHIGISGPASIIDELVTLELATIEDYGDEDEDDFEDDDEEEWDDEDDEDWDDDDDEDEDEDDAG